MKQEYVITYEVQYIDRKEKERTKKFSQLFRFNNKITSPDLLTLIDKLKNQFTDLPNVKAVVPLLIFHMGEINDKN